MKQVLHGLGRMTIETDSLLIRHSKTRDHSPVRQGILRRHGIPPAPQRGRVTDGDRVIVHDPTTTAAIDFAKVLILDQGSICLMSVLIAIHLGR